MSEYTPSGAMTAMSHESTGFCFCGAMHGRVKDWAPRNWEALKEQGRGWFAAHDAEVRAGVVPSRERVDAVVREQLADAVICTRSWEAWQVGTMTEEDFVPAVVEDDFVEGFVDGVLELLKKGQDA